MPFNQTVQESLLGILIYLLENHMDKNLELTINHEKLISELHNEGFHYNTIKKAISWLDTLTGQKRKNKITSPKTRAIRVFSSEETKIINKECRNLILQLERTGVLNAENRELVIDQLLKLDTYEISESQVKWIALSVLFNQADQAGALSYLENIILSDLEGNIH